MCYTIVRVAIVAVAVAQEFYKLRGMAARWLDVRYLPVRAALFVCFPNECNLLVVPTGKRQQYVLYENELKTHNELMVELMKCCISEMKCSCLHVNFMATRTDAFFLLFFRLLRFAVFFFFLFSFRVSIFVSYICIISFLIYISLSVVNPLQASREHAPGSRQTTI